MPVQNKAKNKEKPANKVEKKITKKEETKPKEEKTGWFAVIETGGKQYKVNAGKRVKIEKIIGEYKEGDKLVFDKVLLFDDGKGNTKFGTPYVSESRVEGSIKQIGKAKKVMVVKYKAKSRYLKRNGHRQPFFEVEILTAK